VRVLGVDGCVDGWIVVELTDDRVSDCRFAPSFTEIASTDAIVIGVDIPLGHAMSGPRHADVAAKLELGARRSSVFHAPTPTALEQPNHAAASAAQRAATGLGLSMQAWRLGPKILDATPAWAADPERVREVHPEVSFQALTEGSPLPGKKTWAGHRARSNLLRAAGIEVPDDPGAAGVRGTPDDVCDAAVVAWTAARVARGEALSLPEPPEHDVLGRPVAIWY
jgi:predicted RNase H-like nuclease